MADHTILLVSNGPAFGFIALVISFAVIGLLIRLAAGSADHDRIRSHLRQRGWEPLDVSWEPFGRGWWGEKNDRIYSVRYRDQNGAEHRAWCKTSLWGGVYLSEDATVSTPRGSTSKPFFIGQTDPVEELRKENEKLRQELERLKRQSESA